MIKEKDYILLTDLVKLRCARSVLSDVFDNDIREALRTIAIKIIDLEEEYERRQNNGGK